MPVTNHSNPNRIAAPLSGWNDAIGRRLRAVLLTALVVWAGMSYAAAPGDAPPDPRPDAVSDWPMRTEALSPDPAIRFGRLANGFRYVLLHNRRPLNRVSVHLYVKVGSLNERDDQRGVAHFLEHMMFNGTTHFPPGELVRYFQHIGMQYGNDANAHTGFDQTVYDVILPGGDATHLDEGLQIIHDYATGALLLEKEIRDERGVILSEMRSRDSAHYRTLKATLAFEFPTLLLSRRLPIGTADVIRRADRSLLKSFYDAWYRPENMLLVMVGDFTADTAEALIKDQFSAMAPRAPRPVLPPFGHIEHKGLEVFYHHEPEVGNTTVNIEVIRPHAPEPDSAALRARRMIARMADRIVQNRLDARLKDPDAPFTAAAIGSGTYLERIHYSEISADCGPEMWSPTLAVLEQELRRARYMGFGEAELARVKKDILTMLDNAAREASTRDSTAIARAIIGDIGKQQVVLSPAQEKALYAPIVERASLEEVDAAFKDNWSARHRLVLVSGNADIQRSAPIHAERAIRNAYLASSATVIHPRAESAAKPFPYLPPPDAAGTIVSRETIADLGITRVRLGNGITLNLKQTDFKRNEVLANLTFGTGRAGEPVALPGISLVAEATLNESGLGAMRTDELERALAGKRTYLDFRVADTHFDFFVESVSDELTLLFQLIQAHIVDPGFREDALVLARKRIKQEYRSASRSVDGRMEIEGARILAGGDSRFGMPPLPRIDAIGLDDIRAWIAPQLAHAPLELSIVGDVDPEAAIELARRYLGTLPARDDALAGVQRTDLPAVPAGSRHHIAVDTQIAKALVVTAWQTDDFRDIHRTRRLSVLADIFSERLRERIREKLGIAYSPYAFNRSSRAYPGYGVFQVYVNAAPDQTDAVQAEVVAIAVNLVNDGVTDDERVRAIDPILTAIKEYRQTNGYWLNSVMTGAWQSPEQLDWARTFVEDYGAITTDDLNRLADRYLSPDRAAVIVIAPQND